MQKKFIILANEEMVSTVVTFENLKEVSKNYSGIEFEQDVTKVTVQFNYNEGLFGGVTAKIARYFNDKDDANLARRIVLNKALKKLQLPRSVRKQIWKNTL